MNKKFMAFVIGLMMTAMSLVIPTASAENLLKFYNREEIIEEISKSAEPYYNGDFDLNKDEEIDIFDFIEMKKMLINGESGITVSTLVKFQEFLLGKDFLFIDSRPITWFTKLSDLNNDYWGNLCSHDFRFVKAEKMTYVYTYDNQKYAVDGVLLKFLGCDENIIENIFISEFALIDELETIVAEKESFVIGIKNGTYVLAPKNTEAKIYKKLFELPRVSFDLTATDLSAPGTLATYKWFKKALNDQSPEYALEQLENGKYLVTVRTDINIIEVIVENAEEKSFAEPLCPFISTEEFDVIYAYNMGDPGFGIILK